MIRETPDLEFLFVSDEPFLTEADARETYGLVVIRPKPRLSDGQFPGFEVIASAQMLNGTSHDCWYCMQALLQDNYHFQHEAITAVMEALKTLCDQEPDRHYKLVTREALQRSAEDPICRDLSLCGFEKAHTGGNCQEMRFERGDIEIGITSDDGVSLPVDGRAVIVEVRVNGEPLISTEPTALVNIAPAPPA